jgi:hypothetical protein
MDIPTDQGRITRSNVGPFKRAKAQITLSVVTCIGTARDISGAEVVYIYVDGPSIHQPALMIQTLVVKTDCA